MSKNIYDHVVKDAIRENYYSGDIPEEALLMSLGL